MGTHLKKTMLNVMFKTRAGVFYRVDKSSFRPDKTCTASFLNGFKNIPRKACQESS